MIQSCCAPVGCRADEISGRANARTVLSTETRSTGSSSTASAAHSRGPALMVGETPDADVIATDIEPSESARSEPSLLYHLDGTVTRSYDRAVPPAPAARAKVLDAFVSILLEHGERAATLDAVAAAAGVSKGGLLYHFP